MGLPEVRNLLVVQLAEAALNTQIDRLESLLAAGVDPNALFDDTESPISGVQDGWASSAEAACPPCFVLHKTEMPVLRLAARDHHRVPYPDSPIDTIRTILALLKHGADPYERIPTLCFGSRFCLAMLSPCFLGCLRMPAWNI